MLARRRTRDRDRTPEPDDEVEARLARRARRTGRTVAEEQEAILREVLPNIRRSVAHAGLTMGRYLELDRAEYLDLLATSPGSRTLLGRRPELIDYASFVRLRRWILAAAERAGEDPESWIARAGASGPTRPWERRRSDPAPAPSVPQPVAATTPSDDAPSAAGSVERSDDPVLDRLERLAALRDSGALTADEFAAQKRRILDAGP